VAGELLPIGTRPKLVASFDPPDAVARFREWQTAHVDTLAKIPAESWRVEYGRTGIGPYVRVRVDEAHLPEELGTG
jgi:hypothetical protein